MAILLHFPLTKPLAQDSNPRTIFCLVSLTCNSSWSPVTLLAPLPASIYTHKDHRGMK
uniref:Xyloglucan endotransglucosylase/hydrolase n=1 Tax=Rhizophora mucronata TaxID=61149 RepID=A0A2P2QSN5_RHIMU